MSGISLRNRLTTKAALIVGSILFLTVGIITFIQVRRFTADLTEALQMKTVLLAEQLGDNAEKLLELGLELKEIDLSQQCATLVADNKDLAYAMILDREGTILFHSNPEVEKTAADTNLYDQATKLEAVEHKQVDTAEGKIFTTLVPLFDNRNKHHGAVLLGLRGEVITRPVSSHILISVLTGALVIAVALFLIILFIANQITQPLTRLASTAASVAKGDLTQKIITTATGEIGELYSAFNNMLGNLGELQERVASSFPELEKAVQEITGLSGSLQSGSEKQSSSLSGISTFITHMSDQAQKVTSSMQRLSKTSEETSSSIMEMMASIEEVANNSEALSESVNQTSSSMEEVLVSSKGVADNIENLNQLITKTSSSVTEIDASVKEVESLAQDSRQLSEEVKSNAQREGSTAIKETINEMNQIRAAVTSLNETASTLGTSVDNIGEILNVIDDVAEQTNLLALNAAIIAAQAGEHGRGFAVVAEEIRELAERTSSSTKEIAKVITGIQTETKNVGALVKEGVNRVDRGVDAVGRTDQALQKIITSTERAVEMSSRIAKATGEQATGSREVARSIQEVSERASEMSSASSEQGRGSETIIRAIDNMRDRAEQVRKATVEQTSGARLIAKAGEGSAQLAQEVTKSAEDGKDLSDRVVAEVNTINTATKETLEVVSQLNLMVEKFGALAAHFKTTLGQFRT